MRLTVDPSRCRGHGQCVAAAPHVVELTEDGTSRVLSELIPPAYEDEARTAELLCPEEAFSLTE